MWILWRTMGAGDFNDLKTDMVKTCYVGYKFNLAMELKYQKNKKHPHSAGCLVSIAELKKGIVWLRPVSTLQLHSLLKKKP